jgi:hypothetical protein
MLLLTGCNFFTLREAEEPDKPPLWNSFYTTWQSALQNLEYSYEDARNVVKYNELFLANYRYSFSQQDINDYNITGTWTRDNERDMLYNLHNWADSVKLELSIIPDQDDVIQANLVKLYRSYTLTITKGDEIRNYAGRLEIQMRTENGFWRIYSWYDYRITGTPGLPTWGKLKYDFSV